MTAAEIDHDYDSLGRVVSVAAVAVETDLRVQPIEFRFREVEPIAAKIRSRSRSTVFTSFTKAGMRLRLAQRNRHSGSVGGVA
jgi:hypothetical protein